MDNKDFDQHFYQHIHTILSECLDYANGEIPTQIKIKYSPQTGKNKIKFNYEKLHN